MFNVMRLTLAGKVLVLSRKDGESLLDILQKTMLVNYSMDFKPATDEVKVELLRLSDLDRAQQEGYKNIQDASESTALVPVIKGDLD